MQRRRADIRDYLDEDTEFPGDRLFRDAPYTLSPGYRALLDDAIAYASDRVAGAAGRREQRVRLVVGDRAAALPGLLPARRRSRRWPPGPSPPPRPPPRRRTCSAARSPPTWPTTTPTASTHPRAPTTASRTAPDRTNHGIPRPAGQATDAPASGDPTLAALASRAADLEGPRKTASSPSSIKVVKELLNDGYHPIVFCRYIPTSEYVAEHLDGNLGRKTVVECVNGTLSPAQRLDRDREAGAGHPARRAAAASWSPPTACPRA